MKSIEVLHAEDNAGDAFLVATILKESALPVKLRSVPDGMDALELLASGFHPDLVIVDLNMSHISGYEFIERFHADDVPVVVFSSSQNKSDIERALRLGAREYVEKPSSLAAYTAAVRGMIQKWVVGLHKVAPSGAHRVAPSINKTTS